MSDQSDNETKTPRGVYSDDLMLELVTAKAAKMVSEEIILREERRAKRTAFVFSLLALIGFGGIVGVISIQIRTSVNEVLESELPKLEPLIEQKAKAFVDANIGQVRQALRENETADDFLDLARTLKEEEKAIPNDLRDSILDKIRQLADVKRVTRQTRFVIAMREVVRKFTAVPLDAQLDEIDGLVGEIIKADPSSARYMVSHYGEQIIGSPFGISDLQPQLARIQKYLEAVRTHGYPEETLLWQIFVDFKRANYQKNETTTRLVESIVDLKDQDLAYFYESIERYSNPENWQIRVTQEGRELARLVAALWAEYPEARRPQGIQS